MKLTKLKTCLDFSGHYSITGYLKNEKIDFPELNEIFIKDKKVVLNHISFPNTDDREIFNYEELLKKLGNIWFNYCTFYISSLDLNENTICYFQDCNFYWDWRLGSYKVDEDLNDLELYGSCIFHKNVSASGQYKKRLVLKFNQFNNCTFLKDLILENVIIEKPLFIDSNEFESKIRNLKIENCTFNSKFLLNQYSIDSVDFKKIIFNEKFEFKYCQTKDFNINDCNFEKLSEFYRTSFSKFKIFKSIFSDYTGFEKCEFGNKIESSNKSHLANFEYVTFLSFINFRKTNFYSGLDLENTNLKESPNFLKTNISSVNTSRETFRIIKNSFDKIGNTIEANKFFAHEMKKHKHNLSSKNKYSQEWLVFSFNGLISNFGQSYIRPFLLLLLLTILYTIIYSGFENNFIKTIITNNDNMYYKVVDTLNFWASGIFPFKKFLPKGLEFISLIFLILQSTLIWHFIVAVKRHTKR